MAFKRKAKITFTFEEDDNQVVTTLHEIDSGGFSIFEIIGLLEVSKPGLVKTSYERAKALSEGKKFPDDGDNAKTGEPKL